MPLAVYPMHYSIVPLEPLPIDAHLDAIRAQLARHRALVLTAAPGAGKTTRVPPALVDTGPVIVLQPRRVAARAIARRIATERGWTLGHEVGWQIRFERRFTAATRVLVVTEGVLTARLQQDPLLGDFATIVFDEFHERSLHADVGLALAKQAWLARDDLRMVIMSATLDGGEASRFIGDCPVLAIDGTPHPLDVEYAREMTVQEAVANALARTRGSVLCFLPGAREIEAVRQGLGAIAAASQIDVLPLHGSLDAGAQDLALEPSSRRRIVVATNIAETSLTVPGVSAVVDSGLQKVARYDATRGIDGLSLERITSDAADQRAGRAARLGPGLAIRLWDARDRLRPRREPEIARVDLSAAVLDLLAWGATLEDFDWFETPAPYRLTAALELLERLGAIAGDRLHLTNLGRQMQRLPVHPRLARILLAGGGAPRVAAACALLADAGLLLTSGVATDCDLLPSIDAFERQPAHIRQVAQELGRLARQAAGDLVRESYDDGTLRRALLAGYADRVAKRRAGTDTFTLATGHGATLGRQSGVRSAEWLVALDVAAAERAGVAEAVIRTASQVERGWLTPTSVSVEHELDDASGRVRAFHIERYGAIELVRRPVAVDAIVAADLLARAWLDRGPDNGAARLLRRLRFAGCDLDLPSLVRQAAANARTLDAIDLASVLPYDVDRRLATLAPVRLPVPSGRTTALEYAEDGTVSASVKLQELFGLAETPRIGPNRVPVTFHLLAPNGRPVQTTSDLRSFWERTYPEVRRELRGRYPRHPWPDDPWTATPTARAKPRR